MRPDSLLGLISPLCFAAFGALVLYHGLRPSSQYRSLFVRLRGQPAVQMTGLHRSFFVVLGASLIVISLLLSFGIVR